MKQWYALRSKPRKESSAAALLERADIEVYVPLGLAREQRDKTPVLVPYFPGYLFSRLDPLQGEIHLASYTYGVLYVVGYGGQPCPLPDELIATIKNRLEIRHSPGVFPSFASGDRVAITEGPLKDVDGVFDRHLSAAGRVQVLIKILQRLCVVDTRLGQLRLVAKAAGAMRI